MDGEDLPMYAALFLRVCGCKPYPHILGCFKRVCVGLKGGDGS
jgi:hypothetical protein